MVRWLFSQFVESDVSLRQLAKDLSAQEGRLQRDGKNNNWTKDAVAQTLTNRIYVGYAHIGGSQSGPVRQKSRQWTRPIKRSQEPCLPSSLLKIGKGSGKACPEQSGE